MLGLECSTKSKARGVKDFHPRMFCVELRILLGVAIADGRGRSNLKKCIKQWNTKGKFHLGTMVNLHVKRKQVNSDEVPTGSVCTENPVNMEAKQQRMVSREMSGLRRFCLPKAGH